MTMPSKAQDRFLVSNPKLLAMGGLDSIPFHANTQIHTQRRVLALFHSGALNSRGHLENGAVVGLLPWDHKLESSFYSGLHNSSSTSERGREEEDKQRNEGYCQAVASHQEERALPLLPLPSYRHPRLFLRKQAFSERGVWQHPEEWKKISCRQSGMPPFHSLNPGKLADLAFSATI